MSRSESLLSGLDQAARFCFFLLIIVLPWTIAPMSIAAAACGALTVPIWVARRNREAFRNPVTLPAIGWMAALILSAVFALNPTASLSRLEKGLLPALTALGAGHAANPGRARRALGLLLGSASVAWGYGLARFVAHGASFAARARGPVGHYMTFAGQIGLMSSIALGIALTGRGRWRFAAATVAGLGGVALAATYTRSAWLGMLAALAAMLALGRPRWVAVLLAAAVAVYVLAPGAYRARLHSMFDPHHPANLERTYMWDAGIRMFRDHPLTGVGLEDLKPVYDRYRPPQAHERAGHLHSVPVQIAATMGVPGLVAFVLLYAGLVRCAASGLLGMLRRLRSPAAAGEPTETERLAASVRLGMLGALVGFLVAGLFEWNFGDEELLYPLYLFAGVAWAARGWSQDAGPGSER